MYVSAAEVEISHLMKMTDANSAIKWKLKVYCACFLSTETTSYEKPNSLPAQYHKTDYCIKNDVFACSILPSGLILYIPEIIT